MNSFKIPILFLVGLLALGLIMVGGCAKKAQAPNENVAAETFITTYHVDIAPDSATYYFVTVFWKYSDKDGEALEYRYWTNVDTAKVRTFDTTVRLRFNFPDANTVDTFYVEARDNRGVYDSSPAYTAISPGGDRNLAEFSPETNVINFTNGILTSAGINVTFSGSDIDGIVRTYQYMLDTDTLWRSVDNDPVSNTATLVIDSIPLGARTLAVRATDNLGQLDRSPAEVSFVVVDTLRPDLSVTAGAIPNAFYFLPQGGTSTSVATTWSADASWYYSTLTYHFAVDDTSTWSAWQEATSTVLEGLGSGTHNFYIEARDLAGNKTLYSTTFGVGAFVGDRGILLINGIDWPTYPEAVTMYENHALWGSHNVKFWDLMPHSGAYPPVLDSIKVGTNGAVPGDSLKYYSTALFAMNGYGGDDAVWNSMQPLIESYLNAGGKVLLASRYATLFIKGNLLTYGLTGGSLEFNEVGVNPAGLIAVAPGLINQPRTSSISLTDLLAIPTDPNVTILFNATGYSNSVGGILITPASGGKFGFVAGRTYRFNFTAEAANYDTLLARYFGETN